MLGKTAIGWGLIDRFGKRRCDWVLVSCELLLSRMPKPKMDDDHACVTPDTHDTLQIERLAAVNTALSQEVIPDGRGQNVQQLASAISIAVSARSLKILQNNRQAIRKDLFMDD